MMLDLMMPSYVASAGCIRLCFGAAWLFAANFRDRAIFNQSMG